jgi:hypothetical protein
MPPIAFLLIFTSSQNIIIIIITITIIIITITITIIIIYKNNSNVIKM